MMRSVCALGVSVLLGIFVFADVAAAQPPSSANAAVAPGLALRDGDRVVFLGGTFVERMQYNNYLETLLTAAHPDKHLVFRNLGWSGDTVWGESRGVFGGPNEGFARLLRDVKQTRPTVIAICYGANEAHAGPTGVEPFIAGLKRLLDALADTKARFVLVAPPARIPAGDRFPDPSSYNQTLAAYAAAIEKFAQERGAAFVSLAPLLTHVAERLGPCSAPAIDHGMQLTELGYWGAAPEMAERLGSPSADWQLAVDWNAGQFTSRSGAVTDFAKTATGFKLSFQGKNLIRTAAPTGCLPAQAVPTLLVSGLKPGNYELRMDGEAVAKFSADARSSGVHLTQGPAVRQTEQLRQMIHEKNVLFFHRHRPQNETYLFLFRKHEQGNNAVEIPQFDPLIEDKEKQIAELRLPKKHLWELLRVE